LDKNGAIHLTFEAGNVDITISGTAQQLRGLCDRIESAVRDIVDPPGGDEILPTPIGNMLLECTRVGSEAVVRATVDQFMQMVAHATNADREAVYDCVETGETCLVGSYRIRPLQPV